MDDRFPSHPSALLRASLALYFVASLVHFAHNAEYIAFYPNMPAWLTRENVYVAWVAVTGVGAAGIAFMARGWLSVGALVLAAYGALGLDGLGHYALARCAEHTAAMNLTIGFEAIAGVGLAACAASVAFQARSARRRASAG